MTPRSKSEGRTPIVDHLGITETDVRKGALQGTRYYDLWDDSKHRTLNGYDLEKYHRQVRSGEMLPQTPFDQTERSWSGGPVNWVFSRQWSSSDSTVWTGTGSGVVLPPSMPSYVPSDREELMAEALGRLYASGFDALTFLFELRETLEMFKGAFDKFVALLKRYSPKELASGYLEVRYGWRPLLADMQAITSAIMAITGKKPKVAYGRAGESQQFVTKVTSAIRGTDLTYITVNWDVSTHVSERVTVYSKITPPQVLFDPLITTWELLRLSFVIDWFLGVGRWLTAHRAASFHDDSVAAYGVQEVHVATIESLQFPNPLYPGSGTATTTYTEINTIRVPMAVKAQTLPSIDLNLDGYKVLDLVLILKQALGGKFPKLATRR